MKPPHEPDQILRGILFITGTFLAFAVLDTAAKYAAQTVAPLFLVWLRFLVQATLILFLTRPSQWKAIITFKRPGMQILRALFLMGATITNFFALRELQLAQTVSILFCSPFVVTILGVVLLNEKVGLHRWGAIIVGFCGVLIIFRPGIADLPVEVLYSLVTMLCYSGYTLTTRILAPSETSTSLVYFPALFVSVLMIPFAIPFAAMPSINASFAILIAGIIGALGHWFHTRAHAHAPASTLAPYMYIEIIWMIALGYLVFRDVPDIYTIAGAAVISASGLYLLYRERQAKPLAKVSID